MCYLRGQHNLQGELQKMTHDAKINYMFSRKNQKYSKNVGQMEFDFHRPLEKDRNWQHGGKSFYFFDFDDNVAYLSTPIVVFNRDNGSEILLSSGEFARENRDIGKRGKYKNFFMDFNDERGSFRNFRDKDFSLAQRISGHKQSFVRDIEEAMKNADESWKAPSWNCFYHATYNQRPMSVITARGHRSDTIKQGIEMMVREGHLPYSPNFLSIYAVSNPETRLALGDESLKASVPELKKGAIRESVEKAIAEYGYSDYHRFGMSDDDPTNVELITEEMKELKRKYPKMSFFVIQTFKDSFSKVEVLENKTRNIITKKESKASQLNLFA